MFKTKMDAIVAPLAAVLLIAIWAGGCEKHPYAVEPGATESATADASEQVDLLLPRTIEILPFTKPASFDDDAIPDGIEAVIRPLDAFGDQTKAVGRFRFELYAFKPASSDHRGDRLGMWEVDLSDRAAQTDHWDRITRTYRFHLLWTGRPPRPGKYIIEVTYLPPIGQRIASQYEIDASRPRPLIERSTESSDSTLRLW
jgi:hypothetical protein